MHSLADHFGMLARYNGWANGRLYAAAAKLPDEDYRADRGAFFGSVHGTLNHILLGDRIWMHRFTGTGASYPRLDLILYDRFEDLRAAREAEDERIVSWAETLDDESVARSFTYRTVVDPAREVTQPLVSALAHFFNHQTHHRGQVHAMLTAIGGRPAGPELDLIYFQRETGIGLA
jgi:uncharacterized damage-inducible protein DinB